MKQLNVIFLFMFTSLLSLGQGFTNDYKFDSEDLVNIFKEQGINAFKFPFELSKGEYISISYEMYESGTLIGRRNVIEDLQTEKEIQFNHHHCRKDTTVFHRFYFFTEKDSLKMKEVLPGVSTFQKIDISKVGVSNFKARNNIDPSLPAKREIMFYYALCQNSDKMKASGGWLTCPTGKSNRKLIENYDFVILFFAERINADRAKNILGEDFYKNMSCPISSHKN